MINPKFDPTQRYRYVRYGRMSDPKQNPRSPDQQFDSIKAAVKRNGHPWHHVADYRDDAISGRYVRKRPGFRQMWNDVTTGRVQVDLILVDTLERFGRMEHVETLRRELRNKYGILVLTADSNFADPTSVAGKALGFVESLRASSDAQMKAHNVLRGKRDAVRRGRWPGSKAPFGFRLESAKKSGTGPKESDYRRLVPNPRAAEVVRRIFRMAAEDGLGSHRIARILNSDTEFVGEFGKIGAAQIGRILQNPIYFGMMRFGRLSTDVIEDRRVTRQNPDEEILVTVHRGQRADFLGKTAARPPIDPVLTYFSMYQPSKTPCFQGFQPVNGYRSSISPGFVSP